MEEIITGKKVKYNDPFKELRSAWDSLIQRVDIYRQKAQGIATTEDIKKGIDRLKNSMVESKKAITDMLTIRRPSTSTMRAWNLLSVRRKQGCLDLMLSMKKSNY